MREAGCRLVEEARRVMSSLAGRGVEVPVIETERLRPVTGLNRG